MAVSKHILDLITLALQDRVLTFKERQTIVEAAEKAAQPQPPVQAAPQAPHPAQAVSSPAAHAATQPSPPPAPRPQSRTVGNAPRIMVNVPNAPATQQQATTANVQQRTQPFSAEQLQAAWQGYIDQHPQERALCTTMSYALPQPDDSAEHYVMTVGSPTEQKNVEEHKDSLMKFLCDAVNNDRFTLDIKVSEVPIDTPKILSPREVVEQIKQNNPNFTQFLKDFELGLA